MTFAPGRLTSSLVAVVATLISLPLLAPSPARAEPGSEQVNSRMVDRLAARIDNPYLGRDVSVVVQDVTTGEVIVSTRGGKSMLPASNMKVVTAVTALATMGPEKTFTTRVLAGSRPRHIILQGGGDPMLTTRDLIRLARKTAASLPGRGRLTVHTDGHLFPAATRAPGWPRKYQPAAAAPVRALARLGDYSMANQQRAAAVFRKALKRRGFTVTAGRNIVAASDAPVLAEVSEHTVGQAVNYMLNHSENNVAEILYRHVALAKGEPATWAGGKEAAGRVLADVGISTGGMALMDGSGLSRRNRITAQSLAEIIRLTRTSEPNRFASMYARGAMPIAGVDGTLDDRYGRFASKPSRCARGDIRAKTGTLFDTIGLTGVTSGSDGQEKAFSILVNDRPQRFSALATRRAVDGLAATINGCW
jgi:D-alanyl-D-alanine carboxypeptidase/D-alanyl-D-alanine-endopeptidase (penicillin-binding protein 4)